MPPKKSPSKQQKQNVAGGAAFLNQAIIFVIGVVVVIIAIYGIVFFVTQRASDEVQKSQNNIEKDLEALGIRISDITEKLDKKLEELSDGTTTPTGNETLTVGLFYYNLTRDQEIDPSLPCSPNAVLPVVREIPISATPIQDTIRLLILGDLTEDELINGFTTEFPHPEFALVGTSFKDGTLSLEFTNPRDFTTGGACRVGLLKAQIEKTALQFPGVDAVELIPEDLFQP